MNTKSILHLFLLSSVLLTSCTLSTSLPPSSTSIAAHSNPSLPWEYSVSKAIPAYDVYFAETIDYRTTDWLYSDDPSTDRMNVWPQSEYSVRYYDGTLYLLEAAHHSDYIIHIKSSVDLGTDFIFAGCDYQYVYGILGGTDLVRVDYFGREIEVLFSDPSGKISNFSESCVDYFPGFEGHTYRYTTQIQMADSKVLFFVAGSTTGDTVSIYRLYLPSGTVDEMVTNLSGTSTFLVPVSNHEILWQTTNEDFFTQFNEAYADPNRPYDPARDDSSTMIAFEKKHEIYPYTHFYFNDLTQTTASTLVNSSSRVIVSHGDQTDCPQFENYWWYGIVP